MNNEPEIPFEALEPAYEALGGRWRADPVRMSALLDIPWMRGADDPNTAVHPFDGKCKVCDGVLEQRWRQIVGCPGWFAVNCCDGCYESAKMDDVARIQAEEWERICPPEFRKEWDTTKGNGKLLARVRAFEPQVRRGILIHGATGSCKTRAAWQLVRKLMEGGFRVTFVESIDLPDENAREMMNAPILVIDDMGNDRMQASREAVILKVLRNRTQWHRPTIITTQFTGDALAERFSDAHTAKAVIRRLREHCDDVVA